MELLQMGVQTAITQNTIYALPSVRTRLFTTTAATIQQSNDPAFGASATVTLTEGTSQELAGGFIRCTSGNITISLKRE